MFVTEREELLRMIRAECEDIIAQAHVLINEQQRQSISQQADVHVANEDRREHGRSASDIRFSLRTSKSAFSTEAKVGASADSASSRISVVHPEMLSPEETQALVKAVLDRVASTTWTDFQQAYSGVTLSRSAQEDSLLRSERRYGDSS
jgi:hypothetical protein